MLSKLRADFSPRYLAAVFDVALQHFAMTQAAAMPALKKYDSKTQAI